MTSSASEPEHAPEPFTGLEVATVASDTLRAGIRVRGGLNRSTVALLVSVLHTHMSAGRRYLRVDLADAEIGEDAVVTALVECHGRVTELGGMLIFENAGPRVMAAVRSASLYVLPVDA